MSITDSSSAVGWLHYSTFHPIQNPVHDDVARRFATTLLSHNSSLLAQHIPGKKNGIADSLSRDFHLTPQTLTKHLITTFGPQVPEEFTIYNLEAETISWIASTMQKSTAITESQSQPGRNKSATSKDGPTFWRDAALTTLSSPNSHHKSKAVHSRTKLEIIALAGSLCVPFEATQLTPPSPMWSRPFEKTTSPTPPPTAQVEDPSPSNVN